MRLTLSPLAVLDLEEIGDFIALDNPVRAVSFIAELKAQCEKILDGYQLLLTSSTPALARPA